MTALALATVAQLQRPSDFGQVTLFSSLGLALSLVLVHFGINLGTVG